MDDEKIANMPGETVDNDVPHRAMITACAIGATVLQLLDQTIANVALPYMQGSFASSFDEITWVLTSYITASAIMTAPVGWLAARYGRKPLSKNVNKNPVGDYRYTESGLDNVYLENGFHYENGDVQIDDIDGLHRAIGEFLITHKKDLSGKEIRFLRQEMLLSQSILARLIGVSERAVIRWEKAGPGQVPSPAEAAVRMLYRDVINEDGKSGTMRRMLKQIADMENDPPRVSLTKSGMAKWRPAGTADERQLDLAAF
jgi:DNA-binding transcriptional regulator YiaG